MAALLPRLAITLIVVLAWLRSGAPIEPEPLRRRLAWAFGLALALRLALELLMRAPAGGLAVAMALVAALAALAFLWPLLHLALGGPFTRAGRITHVAFTLIGLIVLWVGGPGDSVPWFWIAFTRCAWPSALRTPERFRASVASLVAGLALFLGVHRAAGPPAAGDAAEGLARFGRAIGIVYALYATTGAFKAFTLDPTLGIRRVSRRLVLSHVLVVSVPLAIVVTLWIFSTYLGVNADRALLTVRAVDRECTRLEESLRAVLATGDAGAGARTLASSRHGHWPGLRVYSVREHLVTCEAGGRLPQDSLLAGWVAALDSLPRHGVVELGRLRYLGAAAVLGDTAVVALEPIGEALDSTLSPLVGAEVRMAKAGRGANAIDSGTRFEALGDSLRNTSLPERTGDSLAL
ncbi:MAG TPA: hypothetical protein VNM39_15990, partial [Verrucomicrobiae bacterium]|nr:hypothetical protein [Verrucomicrobiae bacterium]